LIAGIRSAEPLAQRHLPGAQGGGDLLGDLALDRENVLDVAIIGLGPEMFVGPGIHELAHDADPVSGPPHAPLEDRGDAQFRGNGLYGFCVPLYRMTDAREMTFRSRIFASWVRMSSVIPSAKKAFSGSGLRF
jgi:hypothetical protein